MILLHLGHLYGPQVRSVRVAMPIDATVSRPVHTPQLKRPLHPLDAAILDHVASHNDPVAVWQLINAVAASQHPASRSVAREIKKQLLGRIRPMTRSGLLRRIGRRYLTLETRPMIANVRPPDAHNSGANALGRACPQGLAAQGFVMLS
jgi:hypothetical protein